MTAYLHHNWQEFKTKKELKSFIGQTVACIVPRFGGDDYVDNYNGAIVGPGPYNRKWYAEVVIENNILKKVK
jgi:hypothetical protein